MPAAVRLAAWIYRAALRVLPGELRRTHGRAMAALFDRLASEAARHGGGIRVVAVLLRSLADVAREAVSTRLFRAGIDRGRTREDTSRRRAPVDELRLDVKQSVRALVRRPTLALLAIATFALGIGANTAIFSVVRGVLLRDLPYEAPERIVRLMGTRAGETNLNGTLSYLNARDVAERSRTLEQTAAYDEWRPNITVGGEADLVDAALVNASFFDVLGVRPAAGRFFLPEEDVDGNDRVVVLSHGAWQRRFGGSRSILGAPVLLNGNAHTVVGIAPADFEDPQLSGSRWGEPELWRPMGWGGVPDSLGPSRGSSSYVAIARMRDGVTIDAVNAELEGLSRQLAIEYPEQNEAVGMRGVVLRESIVGDARGSLLLLLGAVALVLAIAAANVGNLLLGRATERRHEVALRAALGASRRRIVALIVTETLTLAVVGGVVGVLLAASATGTLVRLGEQFVPRGANVSIDPLVVLFAFGVTLATGLLCGLVPALLATAGDLRGALGEATRRGTPTRHATRMRRVLVVAEVALALMLLTGAGLLGKSLWRLMREDVGMATDGLLTFDVAPAAAQYPDNVALTALYDRLDARLSALPVIQSVAVTNVLPLSGGFDGNSIRLPGAPEPPGGERLSAQVRSVSASYFATAGVTRTAGRLFDDRDRTGVPGVAVIGEALASTLWPGEQAVGKRLIVVDTTVEVIGVVADVKHLRLEEPAPPTLYLARAQLLASWHPRQMTFLLRTTGDPYDVAPAVRAAVRELDPLLPLANLRTMREVVLESAAPPRFRTILLGAFAALALVLASVGIYGVVSYSVAQRTREMAIRMAVGAKVGEVRRLVVGQGLQPVLLGVAIGVAGSFAAARVLSSVLFRVEAADAFIFVSVPATLCAVALLATLLPARRATRVDPMAVLREE